MPYLIFGTVIFFAMHLYSTFRTRDSVHSITRKLGMGRYMASYSVVSAAGLGLMIYGYFSTDAGQGLFEQTLFSRAFILVAMLPASICIAAAYTPANHIRSKLRHPMLMGILIWAVSHLLLPVEPRDLILFGSFALFSILNIHAVSRRVNGGSATEEPSLRGDVISITIGISAYILFVLWLHKTLFGISPY